MQQKRNSFSGQLGFVLAAAGSAVGLGNIWRFPYLAAKDGGGIFLVVYIILALTFGFALLTTEIAIGRKTKKGPLAAYKVISKKAGGILGLLACLIPMIIMPYYCAIGGWVIKYLLVYITGDGLSAAEDGYFTTFITGNTEPAILMVIFLAICAFVIFRGVEKGIEQLSKYIMPLLVVLIIIISVFSLTLSYTDADGVTRTGMEGLKILTIPNLDGMTFQNFLTVVVDAMGQLFFSLSVAMGIMVAYGSYVKDEVHLNKSINQIEIFDTAIAFLAGVMIIPAVFTFMGTEGMSSSGPGLLFISLPKVFASMGGFGRIMGIMFFAMVLVAALTSAISIMEAVVSSFIDQFGWSRKTATTVEGVVALVVGLLVCFGYNILYFELPLPNGSVGQVLDLLDYISNSLMMPMIAIGTCILVGWIRSPKFIIDEVEKTGKPMGRKRLYTIMVKYVAPIMLLILLLKAAGLIFA